MRARRGGRGRRDSSEPQLRPYTPTEHGAIPFEALSGSPRLAAGRLEARVVRDPVSIGGSLGALGDPSPPMPFETTLERLEIVVTRGGQESVLVSWTPVLGIQSVEQVHVAADGRSVFVVYEPSQAMRDGPDERLQWGIGFDVGAPLGLAPR